jgi:putative ABC transport system ATP-binding protein
MATVTGKADHVTETAATGTATAGAAGPGGDLMIQAVGVTKEYRTGHATITALKGVDFAVARGEMVAVMGPSGCGKTTLLNCLSGLDDVTGGQVLLEGVDLATQSDRQRTVSRARRMGFIFQVYNLLPVLSAAENVELPLLVSGVKPREARERSRAALERVGLGQWATHRPAELSGGQRQRVTIARSLVNEPAIVWADEPTGALDSTNATEILQLMRQLNRDEGLTLVIVTHDPGVGAGCDRIVRMRDGEVVGEERPSGEFATGGLGVDHGTEDGVAMPSRTAQLTRELYAQS